MISARIFLCHEGNSTDQQEMQLLSELQDKLRKEGAEVVLYAKSANDEGFLPFLNDELSTCQWFLLAQSPQAARSSQIRIAVSTALKLVDQRQLQGLLRLILTESGEQEIPPDWLTLPTFDATQDASRTLEKLLLALEEKSLVGTGAAVATPLAVTRSVPLPPSPTFDRPPAPPSAFTRLRNAVAPSRHSDAQSSSVVLPAQTLGGNWRPSKQSRRGRRALLTGLGAAGLVLLGGGAVLALEQIWNSKTNAVTPIPQKPTPRVDKPGDTLYIYRGHTDMVADLSCFQDGTMVASASADKTVQIWNIHTGEKILDYKGHSGPVEGLAWSHTGWFQPYIFIASCGFDNTVKIWSVPDGMTHFTYKGHKAQVNSVAWSPSALHIASASSDNTIQIWNTINGAPLTTYKGHKDVVNTAVWSPDGNYIASASRDKTIHIWSPWNGYRFQVYSEHAASVNTVLWAPNQGALISADSSGTIRAWQGGNGSLIFTCAGHTDAVNALALSPEGRYIASAGNDKTVRVWDAWNSGEQALLYQGHTAPVHTVGWSTDGQNVLSSGVDTTVRVWKVR